MCCNKCGHELSEREKFCTVCGTVVDKTPKAEISSGIIDGSDKSEPEKQTVPEQVVFEPVNSTTKATKRKTKIIAGIALAIVAIVVIWLVAAQISQNAKDTDCLQSTKVQMDENEDGASQKEKELALTQYRDTFFATYDPTLSNVFLFDVTHDNQDEMIVVTNEYYDGNTANDPSSAKLNVYTLLSGEVTQIYEDWGTSVHASGFFRYFVTEKDGRQYLLHYKSGMWQGMGTDWYEIFSLSDSGEKTTYLYDCVISEQGQVVDVTLYNQFQNRADDEIEKAHAVLWDNGEFDSSNAYDVFGSLKVIDTHQLSEAEMNWEATYKAYFGGDIPGLTIDADCDGVPEVFQAIVVSEWNTEYVLYDICESQVVRINPPADMKQETEYGVFKSSPLDAEDFHFVKDSETGEKFSYIQAVYGGEYVAGNELIKFVGNNGLITPVTITYSNVKAEYVGEDFLETWSYAVGNFPVSEDEYTRVRANFFSKLEGTVPKILSINSASSYGLVRIPFQYASASSEIFDNGITYGASNAVDEDNTTSWQEDAPGRGSGESLSLYFEQEQSIALLKFRLGNAKSDSFFADDGKPTRLLVEFSDGTSADIKFDGKNEDIFVEVNPANRTSYIRVTILDAEIGNRWDDTCISEVSAYQVFSRTS